MLIREQHREGQPSHMVNRKAGEAKGHHAQRSPLSCAKSTLQNKHYYRTEVTKGNLFVKKFVPRKPLLHNNLHSYTQPKVTKLPGLPEGGVIRKIAKKSTSSKGNPVTFGCV